MPLTDNSFALCIGVGKREGDSKAMVVTVQDAQYMAEALQTYCGIQDSHIRTITDKAAVRSQIVACLEELAGKTAARKADLVVIYFSGHGAQLADDCYLVANDSDNGDLPGSGISGTTFTKLLTAIQADKMLIFLDCCHSEGIPKTDIPFDKAAVLKHNNHVVLTACHESQVSYLSWPASIFTYALVEGLAGRTLLPGDRGVKIFELAMYVRERVAALSKRIMINPPYQQPQLGVLKDALTGNFMVAEHPDGEAKPLIFEGQFALYMDQTLAKTIDVSPGTVKDPAFRTEFEWIHKRNSIVNDGNGNYILQDANGNTINVNPGISPAELVALIDKVQEPFKQIPVLLEKLLSDKAAVNQQLADVMERAKVPLDNENSYFGNTVLIVESCLDDPNDDTVEMAIKELQRVGKKDVPQIEPFALTLRGEFNTYKRKSLEGDSTEDRFKKILVRLREVYGAFKKIALSKK